MFKELLFVEALLALRPLEIVRPQGPKEHLIPVFVQNPQALGVLRHATSKSDLAFTLALSKSDAMCVTRASVACALSSLRMRKNSIVKIIPRPLYAHGAASVIGSTLPE
jgi:hypothetical protein